MAKVYITAEDPSFDYSPAYKWGSDVVGVFPPGQVHLHPQIALYRARSVLRDMTPDDYLALAGDPVKIAICAVVAAERVGKVKMLRWNRQSFQYLPVEVNFLDHSSPTAEQQTLPPKGDSK